MRSRSNSNDDVPHRNSKGRSVEEWTRAAVMDADLLGLRADTAGGPPLPKVPASMPYSLVEHEILLLQVRPLLLVTVV